MKAKIKIEGMTCASCSAHVDKELRKLKGAENVAVNAITGNAFLEVDKSVSKQERNEWIPTIIRQHKYYKWKKKIIYWHRAEASLHITEKTIWLDSWCVYWKALTAYVLETWEIIQQSALDIYVNIYKWKKTVFQKIKSIFT